MIGSCSIGVGLVIGDVFYICLYSRSVLESPPGDVKAILYKDKLVDSVPEGEECGIILNKTSMYSEAGGQIGDQGWFSSFEVILILRVITYVTVFQFTFF